jgi:hypothetical protein
MARIEHPEFGIVGERIFPVATLDAGLRRSLAELKKRSVICDFQIDNDTLTLWRPWLEGQTIDEYFRERKANERTTLSSQLFRSAQRRLSELGSGHGALHPRNLLDRQSGGLDLVDVVFNSVVMNPHAVSQGDPWLWGPCLPKGWSLEKWDRVSLLRTAALLAQEPSSWVVPRSREEIADLCRLWAENLIGSFTAKPDFISTIEEAVKLLPEIVKAEFELPSFPLEDELEALVIRQGKDRMLRERDEEDLRSRGGQKGLGSEPFRQRLQVWSLRRGFREERELRHLAEEFLSAGLFGESKWMATARACAAAERTFTYFGVDPQEAARYVEQILSEKGWIDERRAVEQCRPFVTEQVQVSPLTSDEAIVEKIAAELAAKNGYPPEVARRVVDLEVERRLLGLVG